MIRLKIRGYAGGKLEFEDTVTVPVSGLEDVIAPLAEKHAQALASQEKMMIEIEFLDEPDPNERFFRFGTDPSRMVQPVLLTKVRKMK